MLLRTISRSLRNGWVRFFSACIIVSFIITCLMAWLPIRSDSTPNHPTYNHQPIASPRESASHQPESKFLAVIVPFRDRFDELLQFVPHMRQFLAAQHIPHRIYVINQVDTFRFNRASLINAGFQYACTRVHRCDYLAMHDVDLLPLNPALSYAYPADGPLHIASPELHPKYHYKTFVGGILLVSAEHFRRLDGMSNRYWGWGLEDDEFYLRIRDAGLQVHRPQGIRTGVTDTFRHVHDRRHRKRDTAKCFDQREVTRKRDRQTGLGTLRHEVVGVRNLTIDGGDAVEVVNVRLECDRALTPWCDCEAPVAVAAEPNGAQGLKAPDAAKVLRH